MFITNNMDCVGVVVMGVHLHFARNKTTAQEIIQSVEPEKRKDLLLYIDNNQRTALHVAVTHGRVDVVEYLCNFFPKNNELILKKDCYGSTALHYAEDDEVARILVESVTPNKQRILVFSADDDDCTALHRAALFGRKNVVQYLCNLFTIKDELILKKYSVGGTALHCAENKEIAKLLVESLVQEKQRELLLSADEDHWTALHSAAHSGKTDIVEYFCSLQQISEMVVMKANDGRTALHHADNKKIAALLIESVAPEDQRSFVLAADKSLNIAVHTAAHACRTDVVKYFCHLFPDEIIFMTEIDGWTTLHCAGNREIAEFLVESVSPNERYSFILSTEKDGFTPLHTASILGKADVVEYLCGVPQTNYDLIFAQSANQYTALHVSHNREVVENIFSHAESPLVKVILAVEDDKGNTPILSLTRFGRYDALAKLLEYVEEDADPCTLSIHLQKHNKLNQNILHLAALSPSLKELYDVLQDYLPGIDMKSMMSSDIYNNTPIHYVAAKYDTAVFTDFMLHLPLSKRQRIADSPNMQLTNCRMIIYQKAFKEPFYIHDVLCDEATNTLVSKFADVHLLFNEDWEQKFQQTDDIYMYDENMLKVLKYSLNEYSLLDAAYITSHTLFSLAVDRQKSRQFYEKQKSKVRILFLLVF